MGSLSGARPQAPEDAWLETPRMYQDGYEARVDGRPAAVVESPDSLVSVAVPRGLSDVQLSYVAPIGLRALFFYPSSRSSSPFARTFRGALLLLNARTRKGPTGGHMTP